MNGTDEKSATEVPHEFFENLKGYFGVSEIKNVERVKKNVGGIEAAEDCGPGSCDDSCDPGSYDK